MKYMIFSTLLLLSVNNAVAQFLSEAKGTVFKETAYVGVDGSPYLFEEFKPGSITDKSDRSSSNLLIRYDSYRDEVQYLLDGRTYVLEPALVKEFVFHALDDDSKDVEYFIFRNGFDVKGYTRLNFFRVLVDGDCKLIRKIKTSYIENTVNSYGTNEHVKRFNTKETDYLVIDNEALELSKGRKEVMSRFGNYGPGMKAFIKAEKLNLRKDDDLVRILQRFNELKQD